MTSDEFDRMVVQGAVKLMLENDRKFLERGGMILAKEFEGELWVKASDLDKKVKHAVADEREACAKLVYEITSYRGIADAIRARGQK